MVAVGNAATNGQKTKFKGTIISRESHLVKVYDKRDGSVHAVRISGSTRIEREKGKGGFFGSDTMDVTALVPGLTVKVDGVSNGEGTVDAKLVKFRPDAFAITVAQQKQILDNRAAAGHAQTTADQAVTNASAAQSSADRAQSTADQGVSTAQAASTAAAANTVAVKVLNQRVSDLGDYATAAELGVYFRENSHVLSASAKASLDQLVSANSDMNGYMIEIAGYASSTGSAQYNQRLSEERAAAVAQYLREKADVPQWRIVMPAGYGETHPASSNADAKGRAQNRRVEVKVLVNKGLQEGS
jgi:outer membrane protein OmpA-like peptidoglycan-associated protein